MLHNEQKKKTTQNTHTQSLFKLNTTICGGCPHFVPVVKSSLQRDVFVFT